MSTLGEEGTLSAYKEKTHRENFFLKGQGFGNTFKSHVTLSACECTAISTWHLYCTISVVFNDAILHLRGSKGEFG